MSQIHWASSPALEYAPTPHSVTAGWVSTLPRLAIIQYGPTSVCLTTIPHHNDDNYYQALLPHSWVEPVPSYPEQSSTTHYANAWGFPVSPKSSVLSIRNKSRLPIGLSPPPHPRLSRPPDIRFKLASYRQTRCLSPWSKLLLKPLVWPNVVSEEEPTRNHDHVESTWSVLVMLSNGQVVSALPGAVL